MTQQKAREARVAHSPQGGLCLSPPEAQRLRDAIEQMDLLLDTRCAEAGTVYLAAMLGHLRAIRGAILR